MTFQEWIAKVRELVVSAIGAGGDAILGEDADMRGYFDDGYEPDRAAREMIEYAAESA